MICIHEMQEVLDERKGEPNSSSSSPASHSSASITAPSSSNTPNNTPKENLSDRESPAELKSHTPTEVFSVDYFYVT